jgi:competence protein ComEC
VTAADGREVRLDLRLVPAALTSWGVTASGILWSVSGVVGFLLAAVASATVAAWWGSRRPASRAGVQMTAMGAAAIAQVISAGCW